MALISRKALCWVLLLGCSCLMKATQAAGVRKDRKPDHPASDSRNYAHSRGHRKHEESWNEGPIERDTIKPAHQEGRYRVLGFAVNNEDAYLPPGKTGWDYGVSGRAGETVGYETLEDQGEDEDEEGYWSEEKEWEEDKLLDTNPTLARLDDSSDEAKPTEEWKNINEAEEDEDEKHKEDEDNREEERRLLVLEDVMLKKTQRGKKTSRSGYSAELWDPKRMNRVYRNNLRKSMAHFHHLEQLQRRSLYYLNENQQFVTHINQSVTILPVYSFERNLNPLVMHLQFYMQILKINRTKKSVICEVVEQMEGAKNHLRLLFGERRIIVQSSLKDAEQEATLPMPVVTYAWYHVRVVALQTGMTVTVTPPTMRRVTLTFHLPHRPILAFANMAVRVGDRDLSAYIMGMSLNNKLIGSKNIKGTYQPMISNPFAFQQPVYLQDDTKHYVLHCDHPYKLKYVYEFEIDLPVPRPNLGGTKSRLLLFGPTSDKTGWALHLAPEAKEKLYLQFCQDWVKKKNCVRTTKVTITNRGQYVLKVTWKEKERSFTVEVQDMLEGLYQKEEVPYTGVQPRCSSKIFIGGLDGGWKDRLAVYQRPVFHFIGALTRVRINLFNIQLNAMVPNSLNERSHASLLNRGHRVSAAGTLPRSPLFVSVPVYGNDTPTLSCWYDSMMKYRFFANAKFKTFWIDKDGNYISEGSGSVHRKNTTLHVGGNRMDNLYTCVVRLEGVLDMVPVTFAVFRVHDEPPKASANTFTAHYLGTAVCRGPRVQMCETYKNVEEEEFIEVQDWRRFGQDTYRAIRKNWLEPVYSGDHMVIKILLWVYLLLSIMIVFLFVSMPGNNDQHGGATSFINRFLAKFVFPRRLAAMQKLLLMEERCRPFLYRPRRAVYYFAEKEAYFTAPQKMWLHLCKLLEPPKPEEELVGFVMWSCLEIGQLNAIEAQDIMLYFNIVYQRPQPVTMAGYTLWRDDWLETRYGKKVQCNDKQLEKKYRHLHLKGRNFQAEDHLDVHLRDMFVYSILKPCMEELEAVYQEAIGKKVTTKQRRILKHRIKTVEWAVRVFLFYQKLPKRKAQYAFHHVPFFTAEKFYEHRQVALVLLKHIKVTLCQLEEAYEKKLQRRMQVIVQKVSTDLQELRIRRYRWFLRDKLGARPS